MPIDCFKFDNGSIVPTSQIKSLNDQVTAKETKPFVVEFTTYSDESYNKTFTDFNEWQQFSNKFFVIHN